MKISNQIQKAIDNGNNACGVFIDLQKAFDTVDHNILINKLEHYGIRGAALNWFKSYLSMRSQFVNINNTYSVTNTITHGVPQGSVLGPLLFIIYINDMHTAIKFSTVHHFADDTNLLYTNKSIKKINMHVNHDLQLLCQWLRANKLSLNADKTELVIFRSKTNKITKKLNFRISGQKIHPTTHLKYLGVYMDEYLNWDFQSTQIILKLQRANCMLSKVRHFVPINILLSIYHAIFSSHMYYGCQIWAQGTSQFITRIKNLQNKAMRLISFKPYTFETSPLYKKHKILKFQDQIYLLNILFTYEYLNDSLPEAFTDTFYLTNTQHTYVTRNVSNQSLTIPQVNTIKYGSNSIINKSVKDWNSLVRTNPTIHKTQSKNKLKNILNKQLFESY